MSTQMGDSANATTIISYDSTTDFNPSGFIGASAAFFCSFLGLGISLFTIYQHLLHYRIALLQRSVIRILFIIPVYSIFSFCSLIFGNAYVFFDAIRDIWEAVVVYCFLSLILDYCGGENACTLVIQQNPGSITVFRPFSFCLPSTASKYVPVLLRRRITLDPAFVKSCKRSTLQFVAIKPIMAMLTVLIVLFDHGDVLKSNGWIIPQGIIYNISYSVALYALALFYTATKNHPGLQGSMPLRKFAAVKIIVFATFWQSVLMFFLFRWRISTSRLREWNLLILCLEMPFIATLQYWAFPVHEFTKMQTSVSDVAKTDKWSVELNPKRSAPNAFHRLHEEEDVTPQLPSFKVQVTKESLVGREIQNSTTPFTFTTRGNHQPHVHPRDIIISDSDTEDDVNIPAFVEIEPSTGDWNFDGSDTQHKEQGLAVDKSPHEPSSSTGTKTPQTQNPSVSTMHEDTDYSGDILTPGGFLITPLRSLQKQIESVRDPELRRVALTNVKDVINVTDVVRDAYYNFGRRYANHSLLAVESEIEENPTPPLSEAQSNSKSQTSLPLPQSKRETDNTDSRHTLKYKLPLRIPQYPIIKLSTTTAGPSVTDDMHGSGSRFLLSPNPTVKQPFGRLEMYCPQINGSPPPVEIGQRITNQQVDHDSCRNARQKWKEPTGI